MLLDPPERLDLLRGLLDASPRERRLRADSVTDIRSELDAPDAHLLASVLAAASIAEIDAGAREAQLHALAELHEWDSTTPDAISLLGPIDRDSLAGSEVEYVSYLFGKTDS